jgi:DEAD/DEAH box helicase domain-containing protein
VNGKPGSFLKIGDRAYYLEPQVELGKLNGVSIQSRVDFMIRPARISDKIKPVAVFLDGFTYHHQRIGQDMAQRMAIVQSGKYHVWSLTWQDVEHKFKSQGNYFEDYMDPATLPSGGNFKTFLEGYGLERFRKYIHCSSFDLLIHFLVNPDFEKWQQFIFLSALLHINPQKYEDADAAKDWMQDVGTLLPEHLADKMREADCPGFTEGCLYAYNIDNNPNTNRFLEHCVVFEKKAISPPVNPWGVRIGCVLHDDEEEKAKPGFQSAWNGFLRCYNFYQFLPYSFFVTSEGNRAKAYDTLKICGESFTELQTVETKLPENDWEKLKEITDDQIHSFLDLLKENGWFVPEAGYELEDENSEIIACAELAWENIKIAFLTDEETVFQGTFTAKGWKTVNISKVLIEPDKYMNLKNAIGE